MSELNSGMDPSAAAGNMGQTEEAIRQQLLNQVAKRQEALTATGEVKFGHWEQTRADQADAAMSRVNEALSRYEQSGGSSADGPFDRIYTAVKWDTQEDVVDANPGSRLERLIENGHFPTDAESATEAVRLLANHGLYKMNKWGNPTQLMQTLRVMGAYAESVPGFDAHMAGLDEVKKGLVEDLAALRADAQATPNYDSSFPNRAQLDKRATNMLGQVARLEAGQTAPDASTPEVSPEVKPVTTSELDDYLDYLEQDDLQHWGVDKPAQGMFIAALRNVLGAAGPDADPRAVIAERLAKLRTLQRPAGSAQRQQLEHQIEQLDKLQRLLGTPDGVALIRQDTELWREGNREASTTDGQQPVAETQTTQPEASRRQPMEEEADVVRQGARVAGALLRDTVGSETEPLTEKVEQPSDLSEIDFNALSFPELLAKGREVIDSIYRKYNLRAMTPDEKKQYLAEWGKPFKGDIKEYAKEVLAHVLTDEDSKAVKNLYDSLAPFMREGEPEAHYLGREINPLDRFSSYQTDNPSELRELLTAIGYRPERVTYYVDALRKHQAETGQSDAMISMSFRRKQSDPSKFEDEGMFGLRSTSK